MRTEVFFYLNAIEKLHPELSDHVNVIRDYIVNTEKRADVNFNKYNKLIRKCEDLKGSADSLRKLLIEERQNYGRNS